MKDMMTIWNNAYDEYVDNGHYSMWEYLKEEIQNGNLTKGDARCMAEDVVETAEL